MRIRTRDYGPAATPVYIAATELLHDLDVDGHDPALAGACRRYRAARSPRARHAATTARERLQILDTWQEMLAAGAD